MNRPFESRARRARTTDSARRAGHSSLGLTLLLGVLLAGVVGARIGWQEGDGAEVPPVQSSTGDEAAEPELTKEERDRRNHLKVIVKVQNDALANIDLMTPAQRTKHDALATEEERLTYLVELEIARVRERGKRLLNGLGDRGTEIYGTLNELPAERRNGHMRKLQNTLSNEYRGSVEKFGDEAGLDPRSIKNAQNARARGRRISWLAEFEQKRLREMRGNGTLPAGMDQATFDELVAEEDPNAFLRRLNGSRLDPPSELGDARDPEAASGGNQPLSNLTDNARPPRSGVNDDGSGAPVRVEPGEGGSSNAPGGNASQTPQGNAQRPQGNRPGKSPRNPGGNGERPAGVGDRDGAQAPRNGSNSDTPDDSGSAERNARPEGVGDRDGGGNRQRNEIDRPADAERDGARAGDPQRAGQPAPNRGEGARREGAERGEATPEARPMLSGRESFDAADKLGQALNKNPDLAKRWAEELGGAARGATPQERLAEYNGMAIRLRELIDESLPAAVREQAQVDRIQDAYLVVAALGAGGVDVTADALLLDQVATVEERAAARAAASGAATGPAGETVANADPSEAAPNGAAPEAPGGVPGTAPEGAEDAAAGNAAAGDDLAASNVRPGADRPAESRPGEQPAAGAPGISRADGKLSMAESRQEAQNLAAVLGQLPQQARALTVELGSVDAKEPQKRLAQFRAKAPKLRELLGKAGLTPETLAKYKVDQVQDVFLVIAVLGAGGVDVSRDEAYLDQLIGAAERRNGSGGDVARADNGADNGAGDSSAGDPERPPGNPDGARANSGGAGANSGRTERPADPNAGRGANAPEGGANAGASFAELRQAAEQERQALLKQLEGRPNIAADLAEVARFTDEDRELTRELPPAEGLRRRYEIAAERVVRKALDGKLMTPDRVDRILSYEPGFLPLTVRQAAGEDVDRDLKRLRQLTAEVSANSALNGAGVPGAGEAQPQGEAPAGEQPPAGEDAPEMQALSAAGDRGDGNTAAPTAEDSAQGPGSVTPAPKPLVGLTVDDSSPDIQLPPRPKPQAPTTGSGAPKRGPRIPPHLRNRPSAREQVESMGDRMRNAGTRPSGQSKREKPKEEDSKEKSGEDKPKADGQSKPAGAGSSGSAGDRP